MNQTPAYKEPSQVDRLWAIERRSSAYIGLNKFVQTYWFVFLVPVVWFVIELGPSVAIPTFAIMLLFFGVAAQGFVPVGMIGVVCALPLVLLADWLGLAKPLRGAATQIKDLRYDQSTRHYIFREGRATYIVVGIENLERFYVDPKTGRPMVTVIGDRGAKGDFEITSKKVAVEKVEQANFEMKQERLKQIAQWEERFGKDWLHEYVRH